MFGSRKSRKATIDVFVIVFLPTYKPPESEDIESMQSQSTNLANTETNWDTYKIIETTIFTSDISIDIKCEKLQF